MHCRNRTERHFGGLYYQAPFTSKLPQTSNSIVDFEAWTIWNINILTFTVPLVFKCLVYSFVSSPIMNSLRLEALFHIYLVEPNYSQLASSGHCLLILLRRQNSIGNGSLNDQKDVIPKPSIYLWFNFNLIVYFECSIEYPTRDPEGNHRMFSLLYFLEWSFVSSLGPRKSPLGWRDKFWDAP